jgi:hypothetical protein
MLRQVNLWIKRPDQTILDNAPQWQADASVMPSAPQSASASSLVGCLAMQLAARMQFVHPVPFAADFDYLD